MPLPPVRRLAAALGLAGVLLASVVPAAVAANEPTMEARVMLGGHARLGGWLAIDVRLRNEGVAMTGELRIAGGAQGRTRYSTPVELGSPSDKTYRLYAQPVAFGGNLEVVLVSGDRTIARQAVPFRIHEANQLVVGVVAENAAAIVPTLDLPAGATNQEPAIVPLGVGDLPDRPEAWATLDHLVWQDVDSSELTAPQVAALRAWVAGGGRLVVAGGTTGMTALSGFPDDLLPYRPTATIDVPPAALAGLLGQPPEEAADLPALAGELARGQALATSGDRAIAARVAHGSGAVVILGFDPMTRWIADSGAAANLWRELLPPRALSHLVRSDDNQLIQAVSLLPALALPPIGGLLALLAGYIVLIGPVNYLVLRRLDRREWAWVTMPVLIAVFAVGAYGYGAALRGLDVIVNEVAIVRGAPNATEASAQVYLGVFSPSRGTYQVEVPGGALLSSTMTGDIGAAAPLDVVQGSPSHVRDLAIGFGSLRTIRAETPTTAPRIEADLELENGTLSGTIANLSDERLERPAVVLGSSVVVLGDLDPGERQSLSLPVRANHFGDSLSNRILGPVFYMDPGAGSPKTQRDLARHAIIDQLTYDPNMGSLGSLPSEQPVLLAWGDRQVVDVRIEGQTPRRQGNVLYYIPLPMRVTGSAAFEGDLVRSTVVESDAQFFNKDPFSTNFGIGSVTVAYRPIPFEGRLDVSRLLITLGSGGGGMGFPGQPIPVRPAPGSEPAPDEEPPCDPTVKECFGFLPGVELLDRSSGEWLALPDLDPTSVYTVEEAARYVDPATGTLLVKFTNEAAEVVSFSFNVRLEGTIR